MIENWRPLLWRYFLIFLLLFLLLFLGAVASLYLFDASMLQVNTWENLGGAFGVIFGLPAALASAFAAVAIASAAHTVAASTERREHREQIREISDTTQRSLGTLLLDLKALSHAGELFVLIAEECFDRTHAHLAHAARASGLVRNLSLQSEPYEFLGNIPEHRQALESVIKDASSTADSVADSLRAAYGSAITYAALERASRDWQTPSACRAPGDVHGLDSIQAEILDADRSFLEKIPAICDEIDLHADRVRLEPTMISARRALQYYTGIRPRIVKFLAQRRGQVSDAERDDLLAFLMTGFFLYPISDPVSDDRPEVRIFQFARRRFVNIGALILHDILEIIPQRQHMIEALADFFEGSTESVQSREQTCATIQSSIVARFEIDPIVRMRHKYDALSTDDILNLVQYEEGRIDIYPGAASGKGRDFGFGKKTDNEGTSSADNEPRGAGASPRKGSLL